MKLFMILLLAFLFSCSSYDDIQKKYIHLESYSSTKFNPQFRDDVDTLIDNLYFYNMTDGKKWTDCFQLENIYYVFVWRSKINKDGIKQQKFSDFRDENDYKYTRVLILWDMDNRSYKLYDSIYFLKDGNILYETKSYCYLVERVNGYPYFYTDPPKDYFSGIMMINKKNKHNPVQIKFRNEEIVLVDEVNGNLRVVTCKLETRSTVFDILFHSLSNRYMLGQYISSGKYAEYIFNQECKIISNTELDNFDYE